MSTKRPPVQLIYGEDGPMAMVRGATDEEVRERFAEWLDDHPEYNAPHHHEWDNIHARWLRANPCSPISCGEGHTAHYAEARGPKPGAFRGAFVDID